MIFLYILILSAHSHSGNTDTGGCHAGSEPYHCHGASASRQVESRWLEIQEESRASNAKMDVQWMFEDVRKMAEAKHKECEKLSTKEYTIQWNPVTDDCSKPYCNYGLKEVNNECVKVYVPENSRYDDRTKSFVCYYGFKEVEITIDDRTGEKARVCIDPHSFDKYLNE